MFEIIQRPSHEGLPGWYRNLDRDHDQPAVFTILNLLAAPYDVGTTAAIQLESTIAMVISRSRGTTNGTHSGGG
jgi:hypothetical protein